jgi:site-specific DNA-methyltransferase (adenine-specific)
VAWNVIEGDCVKVMASFPADYVDAIVSDPPYGLGFQGRAWDALPPGEEWAAECFRVCKPGAHVVAFGGSRTVHRLATALEDQRFEIRDMFVWTYWTGFPKNHRVEVEGYEGYGTALKPAFEPAIVARKPLAGTVADNVKTYGTGAINIEAGRIMPGDRSWPGPQDIDDTRRSAKKDDGVNGSTAFKFRAKNVEDQPLIGGRWPANVYACPKPSRKERDRGCGHLPGKSGHAATDRAEGSAGLNNPRAGAGRTAKHVKNYHPTVKPVRLMSQLVRLYGCRPGSIVLDPFCGSGSTGVAAVGAGFDFLGLEIDPGYAEIARARIAGSATLFDDEDRAFGVF